MRLAVKLPWVSREVHNLVRGELSLVRHEFNQLSVEFGELLNEFNGIHASQRLAAVRDTVLKEMVQETATLGDHLASVENYLATMLGGDDEESPV